MEEDELLAMTVSRDWAREMAHYTRWQNENVYRLCGELSDGERKRDRGMFFGSLHVTLDHILMVDRTLLAFSVTGEPPQAFDPRARLYDDWTVLASERGDFDRRLLQRLDDMAADWLDREITFDSERLGRPRTFPRRFLWMQMYNHGTHHRAQVTAELHRMGIDYGVTDLPQNPYSLY